MGKKNYGATKGSVDNMLDAGRNYRALFYT